MIPDDGLSVLLIEDNPGDARLIEEYLQETPPAPRQGDGGETIGVPSLRHADRLTTGLELLETHDVDVVLLDLGLPESTGLDTLETALEHAIQTPIVVLTGLKDETVGLQAVEQGAQEYLVKDELTSPLLQRSLRYAIERQNRERRLAHQREQLSALNHLNAIVRDINEALIQQSTRGQIEQLVCDRLAASESYLFAWIGVVDRNSKEVNARAEAGVEGYLDDITITADESEMATGPTGRAFKTQEVQVSQNIRSNREYEHWREHAEKYGFESSAAIPIMHEGLLYGVLNVYADRPYAFDGEEHAVIGHLGEIIGHAIAALDRKAALISDEVTEIQFQVRDMLEQMDIFETPENPITFDRAISIGDGSYLAYGTVSEETVPALHDLVEQMPHFQSVKIISTDFGTAQYELHLDTPPVISTLAAQGGYVQKATIEDGNYLLTVHIPPSVEIWRVVEAMREAYPNSELIAQRQTTRHDHSAQQVQTVMTEDLTERQRAALETAYRAGYFNWPRDSSGKEVAESLGVSPPTFHQHIRIGLSKLLEALFADFADTEQILERDA